MDTGLPLSEALSQTTPATTAPSASPSRRGRFGLPLGAALLLVAAIAPSLALYFRLGDVYTDLSELSPDVVVLGLLLTGVAVGLLRKASLLQIAIQVGLTAGAILAMLELSSSVTAGRLLVALFAITCVVPLLLKRTVGAEKSHARWRARLLGLCTVATSSFLNVAALAGFLAISVALVDSHLLDEPPVSAPAVALNVSVPPPPAIVPKPNTGPKGKLVLTWPVAAPPSAPGQPATTRQSEHTIDLDFSSLSSPTVSYQSSESPSQRYTFSPSMRVDFDFSISKSGLSGGGGVGGVGGFGGVVGTGNAASLNQLPGFISHSVQDSMLKRAGAAALADENGNRIP